MNITLDITPQVQAKLALQAAMSGCGVEMYAASLLEQALHVSPLEETSSSEKEPLFGKRLVDAFADARDLGLFDEGGRMSAVILLLGVRLTCREPRVSARYKCPVRVDQAIA